MFNILRKAKEHTPSLTTITDTTVSYFKSIYKKVTSGLKKSIEQPTLLPYSGNVQKPDRFSEMYFTLKEKIQQRALQETKDVNIEKYHHTLQTADNIEHTLRRMQQSTHPIQHTVLRNTTNVLQNRLKELLGSSFQFKENMSREDMSLELRRNGYVRMNKGPGYAAVILAMEESDRSNVERDGGVWVHQQVKDVAEKTLSRDEVLHASWDMIEAGKTPILHMNKIMELLSYEPLSTHQEEHRFSHPAVHNTGKRSYAYRKI